MTDNHNAQPAEEQPTPEMIDACALVEDTLDRFDPERAGRSLYLQSEDGRDFTISYPKQQRGYIPKDTEMANTSDRGAFTVNYIDKETRSSEEWWADQNGLLRYFVIGKHIEGMPTAQDAEDEAALTAAEQSLSETNLGDIPAEERARIAEQAALSAAMEETFRTLSAAFEEQDLGMNDLPATADEIEIMTGLLRNCTEQSLPSVSFGGVALAGGIEQEDYAPPPRPDDEEPIDFADLMKKIEGMLRDDDIDPPDTPPQL